ncbi:MAG: hypothetical protein ACE14T_10940, partial [Syntrophales bacterium]
MNEFMTNPEAEISEGTRPVFFIVLLLVLIGLAAYWPVGGFSYIYFDDSFYVLENRQVQGGLTGSGIVWAFTT